MKYADVLFQGKPGTLEILEEKVMFRPEAISAPTEEGDKAAAAKPIARSWRWVAIDRVDVVVENTINPVAAAAAAAATATDNPGAEVADATDTTTSNRVIKLKAKGQKAKAVSLIAPPAIFDNVVQDLESRLASHKKAAKESSDDTPSSPTPSKGEIPKQIEVSPVSSSAHQRISSSAHESASKHKRTSASGLDNSQKRMSSSGNGTASSHRRLSSSAHAPSSQRRLRTSAQDATNATPTAASNSKRLSKPGIISGRRKTTGDIKQKADQQPKFATNSNRASTQRRLSSSIQNSPVKNGAVGNSKAPASPTTPSKRSPAGKSRRATMPDLIQFSPKKKKPQQEKASTPTGMLNEDNDDKTKWKNDSISPKGINIMDEIQGLPLDNQKSSTNAKSTTIEGNAKTSTGKAVRPNVDLNVSSSSIQRKKAAKPKQTLKPEQLPLKTPITNGKPTGKPKRRSKTTTATTKAATTIKKRNSTGKAAQTKDLNASSSSLRVEDTKAAAGTAPITKRRSSAKKAEQMKESNLSSSSLRLEEARKEATQRLQDSQKDIVFTPTQESKPKLNIDEFIGGFSDPQEMMDVFFTPPFQAKEKVSMGKPKRTSVKAAATTKGDRAPGKQSTVVASPPFQPENHESQQDGGDGAEESSGDEYSDSDTDEDEHRDDDSSTSDLSSASEGQHKPASAKPLSPSKSPCKDPSGGSSLLMNPEAPENKFRMMALQHAATCQPSLNSGRGVCPYDPICGEYRKILEHVESCNEEECTSDKCRSTKQFLVTMRLLEKSKNNGIDMEGSSEQKDFLVGVGAVAPLSFVHVPEHPHEGKFSDTCSAMTDPSWIGDNEPVVEKGRGRGVAGKSRNRVVVEKSRGRGPIDNNSSELEIM